MQFIDTSTGQIISEMQTLNADSIVYEHEVYKNNNFKPLNMSATLHLEKAEINFDILNSLIDPNPTFRVVMKNKKIEQLRYIMKQTKNRRIKRKLQKRINKLDHWLYRDEGILLKKSQIQGIW